MMLKIIVNKLQKKYFPTDKDKALKKWRADGGDYKLRFNYSLNKSSIVIDLGGYHGQWASDLFSRYCCKIHVFEPVKIFAREMRLRFRHNHKIDVYGYGLGGSNQSEEIAICEDGSSVFRSSDEKVEIDIINVEEWFYENNIKLVDLLKVNIEGGEYELLEKLIESNLIKNIKNIQVQFHDICETSVDRMTKIQYRLMKTHRPIYQYRFVWESWTIK